MGKTTSDGNETFPDAKILVGEPEYELDAEIPNLLHPFRTCTVITSNGQFWGVRGLAFNSDEKTVRELWHANPEVFTKRDPNATPVPTDPVA
jgi:hypothetical protein